MHALLFSMIPQVDDREIESNGSSRNPCSYSLPSSCEAIVSEEPLK